MDDCGLAVIQDRDFKYVHFSALPPLFFDLRRDPHQQVNLADNADYAPQMLTYARKMLDWRLRHADRTLTGYAASPQGLRSRR
jgi:arylsulfatase A-like enzyme